MWDFYVPSCHCRNGQEPGENVLSFPGSCVLKERIGQGPMVTNKDRGGLLIKRALLMCKWVNSWGGTGSDGLSQESGEPLWTIWVIPATLACVVVHITLTAGHVIIGLFHC